jgi:hypothetical protein
MNVFENRNPDTGALTDCIVAEVMCPTVTALTNHRQPQFAIRGLPGRADYWRRRAQDFSFEVAYLRKTLLDMQSLRPTIRGPLDLSQK